MSLVGLRPERKPLEDTVQLAGNLELVPSHAQ